MYMAVVVIALWALSQNRVVVRTPFYSQEASFTEIQHCNRLWQFKHLFTFTANSAKNVEFMQSNSFDFSLVYSCLIIKTYGSKL